MPGGLGSWRTSWDYPNDSITDNGQNTEKSPGDLRRLALIQTLVKNDPGNTDVKQNSEGVNNNNNNKSLGNIKVKVIPIIIGA